MIDTSPSFASSPGTHLDLPPARHGASSGRVACSSHFDLEHSLPLEHGGVLTRPRIAFELQGPAGAPLLVVQGGISAGRHVTASAGDPSPGWWQEVVGPGRAIDTDRWRVLAFDYLGGNGDSSGPRHATRHDPEDAAVPADGVGRQAFPTISTLDQARALACLLDHLDEGPLAAFVGASYGGMVGLAFAAIAPHRLRRLIVLSAAHRPHPQATAWRSLQRNIVAMAKRRGCVHEGMALARGLAMITYRTAEELAQRFDASPTRDAAGQLRFPVESYLEARGQRFAEIFDPDAFWTLSQSIDLHRVTPQAITVPTVLVAVHSDQLVPPELIRQLATELPRAELHCIASLFGHDAFLKETQHIGALLQHGLSAGDIAS